jgi:hypothetical protein
MECRYCRSDRHVSEIIIPAWGPICRICEAEKSAQMAKETLVVAQARYDKAVERVDRVRREDADEMSVRETAVRAPGGEDARCCP